MKDLRCIVCNHLVEKMMKCDERKITQVCPNCKQLTTFESCCNGGAKVRVYVTDSINMKHEKIRDYMDFGANEEYGGGTYVKKGSEYTPDMHVSGKSVGEKSGVATKDYWDSFYDKAEYRKRTKYGNRKIYG